MESPIIKQVSQKSYDATGIGSADVTAYQLALSFISQNDVKNKVIVNVGCGLGLFDVVLSKKTRPVQYVGIDFSPVLLRKAKLNCPVFDFVVGDAENLPIRTETVDLLFSTEAIEHFPNYKQAIREFNRTLKHGCPCIVTTPNYDSMLRILDLVFEYIKGVNYTMGQVVEHHFTQSILRKEFVQAGFSDIEFRGIDFRGNLLAVEWIIGTIIGQILRKVGVFEKILRGGSSATWQPPFWVMKRGVAPHYTRVLGKFGLSLGIKALKVS